MKSIQFFIRTIILISFTINLNAQGATTGPCDDIYEAAETLGVAQGIIIGLGAGDCVYNQRSACYQASRLLAKAAMDIARALNTQTTGGCRNCDLTNLIEIAGDVDFAQRQLHSQGYPLYTNGAAVVGLLQGWNYPEFICGFVEEPRNSMDLTGTWCSNNGSKVDITYDAFTRTFTFRMYADGSPLEYVSTARLTADHTIHADEWDADGEIYDDKIIFSDQEWEKDCGKSSKFKGGKKPGYYIVNISGSGWRKAYGGAYKISGSHYKIFKVENEKSSIHKIIKDHKEETLKRSAKYCSSGPPSCPCGSKPYIWETGPNYDIIEFSEDLGELYNSPAYQCADRSYQQKEPCRDYTQVWVELKNLKGKCFTP